MTLGGSVAREASRVKAFHGEGIGWPRTLQPRRYDHVDGPDVRKIGGTFDVRNPGWCSHPHVDHVGRSPGAARVLTIPKRYQQVAIVCDETTGSDVAVVARFRRDGDARAASQQRTKARELFLREIFFVLGNRHRKAGDYGNVSQHRLFRRKRVGPGRETREHEQRAVWRRSGELT
jgi:hypothetical protein